MTDEMPLPSDPVTREVLEKEADYWWADLDLGEKLMAHRLLKPADQPAVEAVVIRNGKRYSGPDAFAKALDDRDPDPEQGSTLTLPFSVVSEAWKALLSAELMLTEWDRLEAAVRLEGVKFSPLTQEVKAAFEALDRAKAEAVGG